MKTRRLAILGSTRGTHLPTLIEACEQKQLAATIECVVSDRPDALILQKAKNANIKAHCIIRENRSREVFDQELSGFLKAANIDLIVLIGFMRILSNPFVQDWKNKIINVHPSLLPAFAGFMDKSVHQAVLDAGIRETGCTVHLVTTEVDRGPILVQKKCPVLGQDTVESLKERVQALEALALIEAIQTFNKEESHDD